MTKFSSSLVSLSATALALSLGVRPAHAQVDVSQITQSGALDTVAGGAGFETTGGGDQLYATLGSLIQFGLSLLGVICLLLVLYAGFLWMTAAGDDKQVGTAKTIMKNAVGGLIIIMSAFAISTFVFEQIATATSGGV